MQRLKPEIRDRVLEAAEEIFATRGYSGATMALIAKRAGVSTGNVYRYFAGKDELFDELFPESFAREFLRLVRQRVASLTGPDLEQLDETARADAERLLRFWLDHRRKVVVVLSHAEGSRLATFRDDFVVALLEATRSHLEASAGRTLTASEEVVLGSIFDNTTRTLVTLLGSSLEDDDVRAAFDVFWSYQLAGLAGLRRRVNR